MKEKLELKHLAPYLPYGLKIWSRHKKSDNYDTYEMSINNINIVMTYDLRKPLLRPLSDFQKETDLELDNHIIICGERFYDVFKNDFRTMGYEKFCWFLEQHYDVFGLIEKGLAIDINKL